MLRTVCELLAPSPGQVVVDATVGLGGHAAAFADAVGPTGTLIGLDVDEGNLRRAAERLEPSSAKIILHRCNFEGIQDVLRACDVAQVDVLFADLGISSAQLENAERGFSFSVDGPLDMRLDDRLTTTAADLVNRLPESELADVIYLHGQERMSRRIARRICTVRRASRITRTNQLAEIVSQAIGVDPKSRRSKIHPATRTFQALRIAVNGELDALDGLLSAAPTLLKAGGRFGVISFHSLEDGRVKRSFREEKQQGRYQIVTKKPVVADADERQNNPRSRSAKLRVALRTDKKEEEAGKTTTG